MTTECTVERVEGAQDGAAASVMISLLSSLAVLADPRKRRGTRYPLLSVLAVAVLGCMCGCNDAEALEDWGRKEIRWLERFLSFPHGPPTQDVFLRVLASMNPEPFREAFLTWIRAVFAALGIDGQIAVDGQTNRGSRDRGAKRNPVHMVSAFACANGLVIGQTKTDEKSNEIKAIPILLSLLDLQGALVSADAMGCQTAIAQQICEAGGDYLFGLKGNQTKLLDETKAVFEAAQQPPSHNIDEVRPPEVAEATTVDKGHGRLETRTARTIVDFGDWVPSAPRFASLTTLIEIESTREELLTGKTTCETRYYVSSRLLSPEQALAAVRSHWGIENNLHWCLDVTFGQDGNRTRTRNAAENLAVIRHFAINLLRRYTGDQKSLPRRRRLCDYNIDYREALLGIAAVA